MHSPSRGIETMVAGNLPITFDTSVPDDELTGVQSYYFADADQVVHSQVDGLDSV